METAETVVTILSRPLEEAIEAISALCPGVEDGAAFAELRTLIQEAYKVTGKGKTAREHLALILRFCLPPGQTVLNGIQERAEAIYADAQQVRQAAQEYDREVRRKADQHLAYTQSECRMKADQITANMVAETRYKLESERRSLAAHHADLERREAALLDPNAEALAYFNRLLKDAGYDKPDDWHSNSKKKEVPSPVLMHIGNMVNAKYGTNPITIHLSGGK